MFHTGIHFFFKNLEKQKYLPIRTHICMKIFIEDISSYNRYRNSPILVRFTQANVIIIMVTKYSSIEGELAFILNCLNSLCDKIMSGAPYPSQKAPLTICRDLMMPPLYPSLAIATTESLPMAAQFAVPNQLAHGKYNLISVRFNKIPKIFPGV